MKVGIVAGEKSGDYLGAEVIKVIKQRHPEAQFVGLCGPLMMSEGAKSLAEMEKISIMGFDGLLSSIGDILAIRKKIKNYMLDWKPDVFVGIDVPDFNLALEKKLKANGIPTVHYVSPTVWAWRGGRIKKIRKAVNLMLTLFPFEEKFYQRHQTPVKYVGHPMAKTVLNWQTDSEFAAIHKPYGKRLVTILPGSRMGEVSRLAPTMLEGASLLAKKYPDLHFVIPAANDKIKRYLFDELNCQSTAVNVIDGQSRELLALCDMTVLASGTAALEAALFAKPMVVMYRVSKLTEFYASRTMVVSHFSMPNHLTSPPIVPELIQGDATVENMVSEVSKLLDDPDYFEHMKSILSEIAPALNENSGVLVCDAIERIIDESRSEQDLSVHDESTKEELK